MASTSINRAAWQKLLLAGCLAVTAGAMSARADDTKAPEKPTDPPPPPARAAAGGEERAEPGAILKASRDRLDQLNLTDEQKKTVDAAYEAARDEVKKAMAADASERRPALQKVMTDLRQKVGEVLTAEQKAKLAEMRAAGNGAGPRNPLERLKTALEKADLTPEQKEKVKPVMEDAAKKFEELRGQVQGGDRAGMREKFTAALEDVRGKLKEILTPDQAEKVKAAMESGAATRNVK